MKKALVFWFTGMSGAGKTTAEYCLKLQSQYDVLFEPTESSAKRLRGFILDRLAAVKTGS